MASVEPRPVALRPWAEGDLEVLRRGNTPEMTVHLGGPEAEEKLLDRHRRYLPPWPAGTGAMFVITVGADAAPAGNTGYWEKEWRGGTVYETGWHVLPEFQGQGVAAAAVRLLVEEARAAAGHRWLHAFPSVDNAPSNALCRKVGFELLEVCDFEYPPGNPIRCNDWRYDLKG